MAYKMATYRGVSVSKGSSLFGIDPLYYSEYGCSTSLMAMIRLIDDRKAKRK